MFEEHLLWAHVVQTQGVREEQVRVLGNLGKGVRAVEEGAGGGISVDALQVGQGECGQERVEDVETRIGSFAVIGHEFLIEFKSSLDHPFLIFPFDPIHHSAPFDLDPHSIIFNDCSTLLFLLYLLYFAPISVGYPQ